MAGKAALQELHTEDEYEYELAKCAGVTGFHRRFFLSALAQSLGLHMRTFAVEADGARIGVLPILLRRRGPLSTANYLPVPHVGPLLRDPARLADLLTAVEPFLLRQRTVVTKWNFAPGTPVAAEPLADRGFHVKSEENLVVLADRLPEDHLTTLKAGPRRDIKVGLSRGMRGRPADIAEVRSWFAERVGAPYARQGVTPDYSRSATDRLVELLGQDPRMLWRSVHDASGQLLTVTAAIVDVDRLWAWMLVGGRGAFPSPQVIAYWDLIDWSLRRGLSCDLGGAPTPGIRRFKMRMGVAAESCLVAERVRPKSYAKLRALRTRLAASLG
jgi:hypothetical protein